MSNFCLMGCRNALLRYFVSKPILFIVLVFFLAASGFAGPAQSLDHPDTAFASNAAIDIITHGNALWLATSRGLNYSLDTGRTWLLHNTGNGLAGNDVSGILLNRRAAVDRDQSHRGLSGFAGLLF